MRKHNVSEQDLKGSKQKTKKLIKEQVEKTFKEKMSENPEGKSKLSFFLEGKTEWKPETPATYMKQLTRK